MVNLQEKPGMIVFPIAKINAGLRILSRREDGYHNIETVFYPVNLHDALEFVTANPGINEDELTVTGIETGSDTADNLVFKALRKLREEYSFPRLKMHLHKAIPAGAGLGGGSSDAACFLKAVNRHFSLAISEGTLKEIALCIGSDCPFFIENVPSHAGGRGELLTPAPAFLKGYYITLLNPGVHVSTREAYSNCTISKPGESLTETIHRPVEEWKDWLLNDFEPYAMRKYPVIREIKESLYATGALFSLMSGSGSTVFGIFRDRPEIPSGMRHYVIYEGIL